MPKKKSSDAVEKVPANSQPIESGIVASVDSKDRHRGVKITKQRLNTLYNVHGVAYRVANKIAGDMFDNWFTIRGNDPLAEKITILNKKINFRASCKQAEKYAYVFGYGFVAVGFNDPAHLWEPVENAGGIDYSVALSPMELEKVNIDKDLKSDTFGEIISVVRKNDIGQVLDEKQRTIHASRLVPFVEDKWNSNPLGHSQLQPAYFYLEALDNFVWAAAQGYFRYGSPLHSITVMGAKEDKLKEENSKMNDLNATSRFLFNEKYKLDVFNQPLSDPRPFYEVFLTQASIALGIPRQILEGTNAGAIAGSKTNMMDYYSDISDRQTDVAQPPIENFYAKLMEFGILPKGDYELEWNPLVEESEADKAAVLESYSRAYQNFAMAGVLPEVIKENIPSLTLDSLNMDSPIPPKTADARMSGARRKRNSEMNALEVRLFNRLHDVFNPKKAERLAAAGASRSTLSKIRDALTGDQINVKDADEIRMAIIAFATANNNRLGSEATAMTTAQFQQARFAKSAASYDKLFRETYQSNFNSIRDFNEAAREELSRALTKGVSEGWDTQQLADEFGKTLEGMNNSRLMTIVRTESNAAVNNAEFAQANEEGMRFKTWVTMGDARVRETHRSMEGQTIPINDAFNVPGLGSMLLPSDYNERCWVEYSQ